MVGITFMVFITFMGDTWAIQRTESRGSGLALKDREQGEWAGSKGQRAGGVGQLQRTESRGTGLAPKDREEREWDIQRTESRGSGLALKDREQGQWASSKGQRAKEVGWL